ncbi:MAG: CRISPR-associated endonuclease Cas3'', partial [Acidobacteriaceae bacterium]|nr:CRISPR-associated endonuclease Cas3'' [Acidobacteriaceae bacterium]
MKYWAHSDPLGLSSEAPGNRWQPLKVHLRNVSELAESLAREAAPDRPALHQMASVAGLLHDYGKYTECFQTMIRNGRGRCPHSIFGAIAARQFGLKSGETVREWAMPVVRAIAAHHGGLSDDGSIESETRPNSRAAPTKALRDKAKQIWPVAKLDQPAIVRACIAPPPPATQCHQDLLTRMLLSCLVDADRLDTAGRAEEKSPLLRAEERLKQLLLHLDGLHAQAVAGGGNSNVLAVREQVQE